MVYFQLKNSKNFCKVLQWKMLVYFMAIWSISQLFGVCYGHLLLWSFGKFFPRFGMFWYQEKSGNTARQPLFASDRRSKPIFAGLAHIQETSRWRAHPTKPFLDGSRVSIKSRLGRRPFSSISVSC
jgi:hypothetical protein